MSEKRVSVRYSAEGGGKVRAEMKGLGDAGTREFTRIEDQAAAAGRVVRRVMGVLGAAVSVRELARYADTWTDLRSRVDLATGSHQAGAAVMDRLAQMARRTYSSLEQTTESYLANSTALRELGMSTRESLDFTEALNNAIVVSGARQQRAEQISNALSQAMALGALRGQQLNTVIMNGGRVAELLAAEMGVGVNQLRALGAQGLITGDVIRNALVGNLQLLREEADSMPATIGDAFVLMGNAALELVGTWDQMLRASGMVADSIIFLADNLERVAAYAIAFAGFMAVRYVAAIVAARVATMTLTGALVALRAALIRTGIGALIVGAGELIYWFGQLVRSVGGFGEALSILGRIAAGVWEGIKTSAALIPDALQIVWTSIRAQFFDLVADLTFRWSDFLRWMGTSVEGVMGFGALSDALKSAADSANTFGNSTRMAAAGASFEADQLAETLKTNVVDAFADARLAIEDMRAVLKATADDDVLDDVITSVATLEDALGRAGGAARQTGKDLKDAGEEALTGWDAVSGSLAKYAEQAMDWGKGIGDAMTGAFRSAESTIGDFVRTGKLEVGELARSILADFAMIGARRFILGPLASGLNNALGGLLGGGPLNAMGSGPLASFDGGGHTGFGARSGGLDGRGGFLAVMHPNETVIDHTRGGGGTVINITNNTGANVTQRRSRSPDGRELIDLVFGELGKGRGDKAMTRFGLSPAPVRR
ncbi:tape measure protein [Roseinatronobacter sp.]|uniref:tape measure protein n=1 Tax=Roseinatronobacter sp. TaxID=1945755 RepID=UPI003F7023BA